MTATSPKAFMLSATLHAAVVVLLLMLSYISSQSVKEAKIFELVAGPGDNYLATEAPALGVEGGSPSAVPPLPKVEPKAAPVTPRSDDETVPNFNKAIQREITTAKNKAKREIAKERAAEAKRLAEEEKRRQEEEKRRQAEEKKKATPTMTKEEFDRLNKGKTPTTASPAKVAQANPKKIDAEGIAKGVIGGSTKNKVGGAGGRALTSEGGEVMERYFSIFKIRLREKFEPPPGLSDSLKATFEARSNADGSITSPRVTKPSGSKDFDQAVLDALKRMRMPPRPDGKSETIEFVFSMREQGEG